MVALFMATACGVNDRPEHDEGSASEDAALSAHVETCTWDPGFGVLGAHQNSWWLEYSVQDEATIALEIEIAGTPRSRRIDLPQRQVLPSGHVKFSGGVGSAPVPDGTRLRLRATRSAAAGGQLASSAWLLYRQAAPTLDCQLHVPACPPGGCAADAGCVDGTCGGGCLPPWSPSWQQTENAGAWWAEFRVAGGGSVAHSLSLEVVGREATALHYAIGRWSGGVQGVAAGTQVILHATDATGATAQTLPFGYLVDKAPATDPCKGTPGPSTCQPLDRGMVTFALDDANAAQVALAHPVLARHACKATFYHVSRQLELPGALSAARALVADAHEVGSYSRTHQPLASLTVQALEDELQLARQDLQTRLGTAVESFASPLGSSTDTVVAAIKRHYASNRTMSPGLNYVGSDVLRLSSDGVLNTSSVSAVCAQLAQAAALRGWRILVFHNFTSAASASASLTYPIADFEALLVCAKNTPGLDVVTTRQGVARIGCATP